MNDREDLEQPTFWNQLRKRRVFRSAFAYGVGSFVIVQLIDAVGDTVGFTETAIRWVLGTLIVGFPIVVAAAWYFEVSGSSIHLDDRFRRTSFSRKTETSVLTLLFATALTLATYLLWFSNSNPQDQLRRVPSIAVMPFLSLGAPNQILSHGLPDQLLSRLDKLTEFNILSRTSSFSDRLRGKDSKFIGEALGVDHILEGSVQQEGDRVVITTQLILAASGRHLWSETYDREIDNLLDLEMDIAQQIASTLNIVLSAADREALATATTTSPEAFELNLQGWSYYRRPRSEMSLSSALKLFESAISLDPNFQDPQVGKCQALLAMYRVTLNREFFEQGNQACLRIASSDHRPIDVLVALGDLNRAVGNSQQAEQYYNQALAKDETRPDAYEGLARAYSAGGDYEAAESTYKRGLLNSRSLALIHRGYGYFLAMRERYADAAVQFEEAVRIAPDDGNAFSNLGLTLFLQDDWEQAENAWEKSLAIKRDVPVLYNLSDLLYYQHRFDDARVILEELLARQPDYFIAIGKLGAVHRELGNSDRAAELFSEAYSAGEPDGHVENTRINRRLASYAANMGDFEEAHRRLDEELSTNESDATLHYFKALTLSLEGRYPEAVITIERAQELGYSSRLLDADPVLARAVRNAVQVQAN